MKGLFIVIVVFLLSCSQEPDIDISSINNNSEADDLNQKTISASTSSLTAIPRKFSRGETLYITYCSDCHGWEGRGNGQAAKYMSLATPVLLQTELLAEKSEKQFVDWVLSGKAVKLQLKNNAVSQIDTEVSAILAHIKKLPRLNWNQINTGQNIYDGFCASCHGNYGHGDGGLASQMPGPMPDLSDSNFQKQLGDQALEHIISKGKDAMPGTENILTPKEIKAVTAYLGILSPGYESYDRYCSNCHGVNGTPIEIVTVTENEKEYAEFERLNLLSFDSAYLKSHTDKQLIPKIKHMLISDRVSMPHFAEYLKREEAREIFRYLGGLMAEYP